MSEFHLKEISKDIPQVKDSPKTASIPVSFSYIPSDDGTDENLLILLHGLGEQLILLVQSRETEMDAQEIHILLLPALGDS